MSLRVSCLLFFCLMFFAAPAIHADVIYSNFGVDDTYATGAGMIVTNDDMAWSSVAIQFIPANNYNLTGIEFVASDIVPDDPGISIGIFADNNGQPGGEPIESFSVSGLGAFGGIVPVTTVTSTLQPLLLADTPYWVGMQGPVGGFVIWNQNVTGADGFSSTDGNGNWSASGVDQGVDQGVYQGVVEIDGTVNNDVPPPVQPPSPAIADSDQSPPTVPEPSVVWLTFSGLIAMLALRRPKTTTR